MICTLCQRDLSKAAALVGSVEILAAHRSAHIADLIDCEAPPEIRAKYRRIVEAFDLMIRVSQIDKMKGEQP